MGVAAAKKPAKAQRYFLQDGDRVCVLGECRKRNYEGVTGLQQLTDQDSNSVEPGEMCVPSLLQRCAALLLCEPEGATLIWFTRPRFLQGLSGCRIVVEA